MDNTNSKRCKNFETELWLLLDDSMDGQSRAQWNLHLENCAGCANALKEAKETIGLYNNIPPDDIKNSTFKKMIKKSFAVDNQSLVTNVGPSLRKNRSLAEIFGFYKLAFGGSVLVAALIFIFITFVNDPKMPDIPEQIPKDILAWNSPDLNNRLNNVEDQIISLQTKDWDIYIIRKNKKQEWNSAIRAIQKQIRNMRKEVGKTSM